MHENSSKNPGRAGSIAVWIGAALFLVMIFYGCNSRFFPHNLGM